MVMPVHALPVVPVMVWWEGERKRKYVPLSISLYTPPSFYYFYFTDAMQIVRLLNYFYAYTPSSPTPPHLFLYQKEGITRNTTYCGCCPWLEAGRLAWDISACTTPWRRLDPYLVGCCLNHCYHVQSMTL